MTQNNSPYNVPGFLTQGEPQHNSPMRMFLGTSHPAYHERGDTLNTVVVKKLIHFFRISDFYSEFAQHPDYFNILATDCDCPVDIVPLLRQIYIGGRNAWLNRKRVGMPQVGMSVYAVILAALVDKAKLVDDRIGRGKEFGDDQIPQRAVEKSIQEARAEWQSCMQADPMALLFSPRLVPSSQNQILAEERNGGEPASRQPIRRDQPSHFRSRSTSPASRQPGASNQLEVEYRVRTPLGASSGRKSSDNESTTRSTMTDIPVKHELDHDADGARTSNDAVTAARQPPSILTTEAQNHQSPTANVGYKHTQGHYDLKTKATKLKTRFTKLKKSSQTRYAVFRDHYTTHIAMAEERGAKLQADMDELKKASEKRYAELEAKYDKLATTSRKHAEDIKYYEYVYAYQSLQIKDLRKELKRHDKIFKDVGELLKSWEDKIIKRDE